MSFTLTGTPTTQNVVPLYNPFYYITQSSNSTKRNFKYIFDLSYSKNGGSPTLIGRFKVYPNPTDNKGYFTPHSIFQNYVNNNEVHPTITNLTVNDLSWVFCYIDAGEEYDDSPLSAATGTTVYPNLANDNIVGLNSIFQSNESVNLIPYDLNPVANNKYFLTSWQFDWGDKKIFSDEWDTISAFQSAANQGIFYIDYWTYNATGGTIGHFRYTNSTNALKLEIPSGTKNLYLMTATNLNGGGSRKIVDSDVYRYTISINDTNDNSRIYSYSIVPYCERFEKFRICWLNPLGGYDYQTFFLMKRDFIKVNRSDWEKKIGYGYQIGDRGRITNSVNGDVSFVVTSDWLTQFESLYIQNLFTSPSVYYIDNVTNNLIPLMVKTTDFELKKTINDDLINYTIEFEMAHKKYGQNG